MDEVEVNSNNDQNENYFRNSIKIYQPKLIKIRRNTTGSLKTKRESAQIEKKESTIKQSNSIKFDNEYTIMEKLSKFNKNPSRYISKVLSSYYKENKLEEKVDPISILMKEFEAFGNKTKEEIIKVVENQIKKLENKKIQKNQKEAEEVSSQPISHEELIKTFMIKNESKFDSVINSRQNIKNNLLNDKFSSLNKNSILKKTLDCLKGENIEVPSQNFLQVKDININDLNIEEMQYTQNLLNMQRQFENIKQNADLMILNQIEKTSNNEQQIYNNLVRKTENCLNKMESATKISEEMITSINKKLNEEFNKELLNLGIKQFNVHDMNLHSIKKDLNAYHEEEQNIANNLERLKIIEENNKMAEEKIKLFLKKEGIDEDENNEDGDLNDKEIDQLYQKFKILEAKPNKKKTKIFCYNQNYVINKQKKVVKPTISAKYK